MLCSVLSSGCLGRSFLSADFAVLFLVTNQLQLQLQRFCLLFINVAIRGLISSLSITIYRRIFF
jgi:hypothetical protein